MKWKFIQKTITSLKITLFDQYKVIYTIHTLAFKSCYNQTK